jgi:phthiodiolone/phenolphthiodiolone dimycocerosates ketoreductase
VETVLRLAPFSSVALGIGAGERENLEPYGLPPARVGRVEEYLEVLRQAVQSGRVDHHGQFFSITDAPVPAPLSAERLEVWVGAHGPRMLELTAQRGDGWLPMGFPPGLVAKRRTTIDAARPAERAPIRSSACVVVALVEDEAEVAELTASTALRRLALFSGSSVFTAAGHRHPLGEDFNPMTSYVPARLSADEVRAAVDQVPPEVVSRIVRVLTAEQVGDLLDQYGDAGVDHLVLWDVMHLVRPGSRGRSIQMLCDAARPQPVREGAHARH